MVVIWVAVRCGVQDVMSFVLWFSNVVIKQVEVLGNGRCLVRVGNEFWPAVCRGTHHTTVQWTRRVLQCGHIQRFRSSYQTTYNINNLIWEALGSLLDANWYLKSGPYSRIIVIRNDVICYAWIEKCYGNQEAVQEKYDGVKSKVCPDGQDLRHIIFS